MKICVIVAIKEALNIIDGVDVEMERNSLLAGPQTELSHVYVPSAPAVIESEYEDALAVPGTVQAAIKAEEEGFDGILINCTADTGLAPCREAVSIPVVGPTIASMHLAAQLTHRFSVLSFLDRVNQRFEEMAWNFGLHHKLASVRSLGIPVLDVAHDETRLVNSLFEAGMKCIEEDGAHGLILGCTLFEAVSKPLSKKFHEAGVDMPLFEPFLIGLRQVEMQVSMRISHSKLTYPRPGSL